MSKEVLHIGKTRALALLCAALIACVAFALCGCAGGSTSSEKKGLDDFANSRVAVVTGSYQQNLAERMWPDAEMLLFNTAADQFSAVQAGKADCAVISEPAYVSGAVNYPDLVTVEEKLPVAKGSFIWPKGGSETKLYQQMEEYLAKIQEDGTYDEILAIWKGSDESKKTIPPIDELSGENGTIALIVAAIDEPYEYWKDNRIVGSDIDLVYRFCQEYGYTYTMDDMPFESLIMGLNQGKYDFSPTMVIITEERAKSVDFSTPLLTIDNVVVYRNASAAAGGESGFFESLGSSFERTFVSESRWLLILGGLGVTLIVALLSAILGTALGFVLSLLRHYCGKAVNAVIDVYVRLLQGLPVLVLLLIFYYVLFGSVTISSIFVSVIVFALNVSANICENLSTCIASVHPGQREAAIAAGFTERQAFYRFVLPIAVRRAMPVYIGELTSLVKSTSIVGYIALVDLTKAGDIIRSRTYEAVFPLIAIAAIYLLITWLVSRLLKALERVLTPERPKTSIKGVKCDISRFADVD